MAKKKAKPKDDDDDAEGTSAVAVNDAWTGMLVISFLALSIGTGFVMYEYAVRYNWGEEPRAVPKANVAPAVKPVDPPPVKPPVDAPPVKPPVDAPPVKPPVDAPPVEKVDATRPLPATPALVLNPRLSRSDDRRVNPALARRISISPAFLY